MTITAMTLDSQNHNTESLDWLIQKLGIHRTLTHKLRFTRGSSVECRLGDNWGKGLVADIYPNRNPYTIKLDEGISVYAPFDTDEVIRAGAKRPLRFKEGDAVEILLREGWQSGVVASLWEMEHPYWVYITSPNGEPVYMAVPFDSDELIRREKNRADSGVEDEKIGSEQDLMLERVKTENA